MENKCIFSPDRRYRYTLLHQIKEIDQYTQEDKIIAWIGLNPSTADEQKLDPTLRRVRGFTERFGGTAFVMLNLFAYRATLPQDMKAQDDPIGPENDIHLLSECCRAKRVICAWGNHGAFQGRASAVLAMLREWGIQPECLRLTKAGFPEHPLYLPKCLWPGPVC